eukprot:PhF_6_TR31393/c0_g1_i2/m.45986
MSSVVYSTYATTNSTSLVGGGATTESVRAPGAVRVPRLNFSGFQSNEGTESPSNTQAALSNVTSAKTQYAKESSVRGQREAQMGLDSNTLAWMGAHAIENKATGRVPVSGYNLRSSHKVISDESQEGSDRALVFRAREEEKAQPTYQPEFINNSSNVILLRPTRPRARRCGNVSNSGNGEFIFDGEDERFAENYTRPETRKPIPMDCIPQRKFLHANRRRLDIFPTTSNFNVEPPATARTHKSARQQQGGVMKIVPLPHLSGHTLNRGGFEPIQPEEDVYVSTARASYGPPRTAGYA